MPLRHHRLLALGMLALALAGGLLGGCGPKAASAPGSAAPAVKIADIQQMTPAEKTSQIATSFPLQVPVASGEVVRGEAQGDSAWVYQVIVPADVASTRNWYLNAYNNAEWTLTKDAPKEITLEKGSAQSRLQFEAVDTGTQTRTQITAAVGVGTPVLQTQ